MPPNIELTYNCNNNRLLISALLLRVPQIVFLVCQGAINFLGLNKDAMNLKKLKNTSLVFLFSLGVALISMCVSLIQEQAARSAALAMGVHKEVIEMDIVVIVKRRPRYQSCLQYFF